MIKFEITLPHNDGMTKMDIVKFFSFTEELKIDDIKFLLEGNTIKQVRPMKITMKRSK